MNKTALVLTINKFSTYFETQTIYKMYDSLEIAKQSLIDIIFNNFNHINIDYPSDLIDFEYKWFKEQYVKTNAFVYQIYNNDTWSEPWDSQDIYEDVLEKIQDYENKNIPDFSKIYGEPNPDMEEDDNFTSNHTEHSHEFEQKLKEIISAAQNTEFKDDQVKDCNCKQCQEGYKIQLSKKLDTDNQSNIIV
jgi:hypothetical protein